MIQGADTSYEQLTNISERKREQQQCQLEITADGETFGLGESVTITVTNGGDEALEFPNTVLGLEIENRDTGEAYPLFSAQVITTSEPGESDDAVLCIPEPLNSAMRN